MSGVNALPFSPLTQAELTERCNQSAWLAVCSLTFGDRYPASSDFKVDSEDALREARKATEFHAATMARIEESR